MIRAYVSDHAYGFGVAIALISHPGENSTMPAQIMRLGENAIGKRWDEIKDGVTEGPTLVLEDHEARALLDGLMRHFHGAEDTRALRADYDAERKRVDKLTDAVISLASLPGAR